MAFLGVRIPLEVGRMLNEIDVPGVKESPSEYHITILCFDDNWPITEASKALEATYDVVNKEKPFTIEVNKVNCFPKFKENPLPIIARVDSKELHNLSDKLRKKFDEEDIDYKKNFKEFNPHITLSYDKELKDFDEVKIDPVTFTVQDIVLWGGDYGDSRLFVNFQLKSPAKHAGLIEKIDAFYKTAQISHYHYDSAAVDKFLDMYNNDEDENAKKNEFDRYGAYGIYYFDIVPIDNIENKDVWNKDKFDINLSKMKENVPLEAVKLSKPENGGKFKIIDGIHRIAASKELGYKYVPALINEYITTPPNQTKNSLFDKINMFYKLAFIDPDGYLTPTRERREKDR
jgi:2'-5' RNA ligase